MRHAATRARKTGVRGPEAEATTDMSNTMIPILATSLFLTTPFAGAAAQPPEPIDFASLSARYSVYPSTDSAQKRIGEIVPAGLPADTARARLTALGMSCGAIRGAAFRCHYSTSVTVDALYIQPIVWVVTVRGDQGLVRTAAVSVD
jgi:hypothetical protein